MARNDGRKRERLLSGFVECQGPPAGIGEGVGGVASRTYETRPEDGAGQGGVELTGGIIEIQAATVEDLPRIFAIYNREVREGIATFDIDPREPGRDDGWLTGRAPYHPVIVAIDGEDLIGWASIGPWSPRGAYRRTGEVSVYVDRGRRRGGIGRQLLADLIDRARRIPEISVLLARIAQPNPTSVAIHEAVGFRSFGTQRACGEKLGRVLDVELFDLHLDE